MSQLLCEQVVGRGLRRARQVLRDGKFDEEVAQIFGVPFEVIPFKANKQGAPPSPVKRHHVRALPAKSQFEIRFPRVEGYTQAIRNKITVNWSSVPPLPIEPDEIPTEVDMKAALPNNQGRPSLSGPGKISEVNLDEFRKKHRIQEIVFDLARALTRDFVAQPGCELPAQVLFPQILNIVARFVEDKVQLVGPADKKDVFLAPYYGWAVERLLHAIRPDTSQGEAPEIPRYETGREPGSTNDVDFWTSRDVREVIHSHVNYVVADTQKWEQQAAYIIDKHPAVAAFVKNAGLGFAIPYFHNGQMHDYLPDFIIRLKCERLAHLILETKGYDELEEVKRAAAVRWVNAVNAEGSFGQWQYDVAKKVSEIPAKIKQAIENEQ
jgi:type III restriction enzyme